MSDLLVESRSSGSSSLPPVSRSAVVGGWIMGLLPSLFLLMDAGMKLAKPKVVVEGTVKYGYSENVLVPLGIVLLSCTVLYLIPRTALLGAILLTGYLGGAVATHVRASDPAFNIVFPVIFGALLWGGLYLRDRRVRALIPLRSHPDQT